MITTHLKIEGMTCANCVTHVEKALEAVKGVEKADVSLDQGATVEHNDVPEEELIQAVAAAGGYRAEVAAHA